MLVRIWGGDKKDAVSAVTSIRNKKRRTTNNFIKKNFLFVIFWRCNVSVADNFKREEKNERKKLLKTMKTKLK